MTQPKGSTRREGPDVHRDGPPTAPGPVGGGQRRCPPCELRRWSVIPRLSPPGTGRYNGGAEAGIGSLKTRIFYQAIDHGTWGWTFDDVAAARR